MPNRALIQSARIKSITQPSQSSFLLPPQFTHLSLTFGQRNANGHMGPRKFAQHDLPNLAYFNQSLKISVRRIKDPTDLKNEKVKAFITLKREGDENVDIQIQGLHSDEIVRRLKEVTGATQVKDETTTTAGSAVTTRESPSVAATTSTTPTI